MRRRAVQAALIVIAAAALATGVSSGSENREALIFAQNLLWAVMGGVIGTVYLFLLRGQPAGRTRSLMLGIMLTSFAVMWHRGWFAGVRYAQACGCDRAAQWLLDNAWMLAVPIGAAVVGYAHHARPLLEARLGEWWLSIYVVAVLGVWSFIVTLVP